MWPKSRSILQNGSLKVPFSGPDLQPLMDIRAAKLSFEQIGKHEYGAKK
jgi:hypothetical protein